MKWLLVSYLLGADFNEAQPSPGTEKWNTKIIRRIRYE